MKKTSKTTPFLVSSLSPSHVSLPRETSSTKLEMAVAPRRGCLLARSRSSGTYRSRRKKKNRTHLLSRLLW
ncbi:hypothetical protein BHE74_00035377, partial [Ensete ventricosum]